MNCPLFHANWPSREVNEPLRRNGAAVWLNRRKIPIERGVSIAEKLDDPAIQRAGRGGYEFGFVEIDLAARE